MTSFRNALRRNPSVTQSAVRNAQPRTTRTARPSAGAPSPPACQACPATSVDTVPGGGGRRTDAAIAIGNVPPGSPGRSRKCADPPARSAPLACSRAPWRAGGAPRCGLCVVHGPVGRVAAQAFPPARSPLLVRGADDMNANQPPTPNVHGRWHRACCMMPQSGRNSACAGPGELLLAFARVGRASTMSPARRSAAQPIPKACGRTAAKPSV